MRSQAATITAAFLIACLPACSDKGVSSSTARVTPSIPLNASFVAEAAVRLDSKEALTELSWNLAENPAAQPAFADRVAACLGRDDILTNKCETLLSVLDGVDEKLAQDTMIRAINGALREHAKSRTLKKMCSYLAERVNDTSALVALTQSGAPCRVALATARMRFYQKDDSLPSYPRSTLILTADKASTKEARNLQSNPRS